MRLKIFAIACAVLVAILVATSVGGAIGGRDLRSVEALPTQAEAKAVAAPAMDRDSTTGCSESNGTLYTSRFNRMARARLV